MYTRTNLALGIALAFAATFGFAARAAEEALLPLNAMDMHVHAGRERPVPMKEWIDTAVAGGRKVLLVLDHRELYDTSPAELAAWRTERKFADWYPAGAAGKIALQKELASLAQRTDVLVFHGWEIYEGELTEGLDREAMRLAEVIGWHISPNGDPRPGGAMLIQRVKQIIEVQKEFPVPMIVFHPFPSLVERVRKDAKKAGKDPATLTAQDYRFFQPGEQAELVALLKGKSIYIEIGRGQEKGMDDPAVRAALIADIKPLAEAGVQFTVSTDAHGLKDLQQPFAPEKYCTPVGVTPANTNGLVRELKARRAPRAALPLAGAWDFALDPSNAGLNEKWETKELGEKVTLPGSLDENGKGTPNVKASPSFLSRLHEYVGPAWYQRDIVIPDEWRGKPLEVFLERCHWETRLWVDGQPAGLQDSLCAPHRYALAPLAPGKHRITLRIDNSVKYNVGMRAHSITEHTQTNWNGVVGRMEVRPLDAVRLTDLKVYPDAQRRSVRVRGALRNDTKQTAPATVKIAVLGLEKEVKVTAEPGGTAPVELTLDLGSDAPLWDSIDPRLIDLDVSLASMAVQHTERLRFGLRDIGRNGSQLTLNGLPYFVRGTLECCIFPLTGYPATDVDTWRNMMRTAREYGLNHFRFHSWCPPEAAFIAADETGMTLHVETPVWSDLGKNPVDDQYIRDESDRILSDYGNHPSFTMLAVGNEPSGPNKDAFLRDIVQAWQKKDPRRLYTTCAGWPELPESDFHVVHERNKIPYRVHGGPIDPNTAIDYTNVLEGCQRPAIAHELGQWCVYPDYREIATYTGVLRARNLEGFRESLRRSGMLDQDQAFAWASGQLQRLMYKADIEALLRTPGAGGFQLLALQDFPGQGSALEGFVDAFWHSKGATTPDQFRQFCGDTVPLLRLAKVVWTRKETVMAHAEIAHYGNRPLAGAHPYWTATTEDGVEVACGDWPVRDIPIGNGIGLGDLTFDLSKAPAPAKLTLTVGLAGTPFRNTWDIWVYPTFDKPASPGSVRVASEWNKETESALRRGERVLLLPKHIAPKYAVKSAFEPIFWNTQWFPGQDRQLGILCNPKHAAFGDFPTDGYTNWQWHELLRGSTVLRFDTPCGTFRPLVQVIDDWNKNRMLGALFEARVGKGRLLVCTLDLDTNLERRPAAAALRRSLLRYMNTDAFAPVDEMKPSQVARLFAAAKSEIAQVEADSAAPGYAPENAVDGDRNTIWHTPWENPAPFPHALKILFQREVTLDGLRYLPRQDVPNAYVGKYEVYAAKDGRNWGAPVAFGEFPRDSVAQEIRFSKPVQTKWLRFVATTSASGDAFVAVAELEPMVHK